PFVDHEGSCGRRAVREHRIRVTDEQDATRTGAVDPGDQHVTDGWDSIRGARTALDGPSVGNEEIPAGGRDRVDPVWRIRAGVDRDQSTQSLQVGGELLMHLMLDPTEVDPHVRPRAPRGRSRSERRVQSAPPPWR